MKRCPTCNRTFAESHLTFCTEDGTPLVNVERDEDDGEATVVSPPPTQNEGSEPEADQRQADTQTTWDAPAYQPPGRFHPAEAGPKQTAWPWVLGTLAVIFLALIGLGIAAAIFVPDIMKARRAENENRATGSSNTQSNENSSVNSNANTNSGVAVENGNKNANVKPAVDTPPPENQDVVLADLRNIEDEWTVANLNADKQKLEWILADDYVGLQDGVMQGKAEYLRDIKPDPAVKHWDFRDLRVTLIGNRATLTGVVRLATADQDEEVLLNFIDKFVWREGRWQAVASEVRPVK